MRSGSASGGVSQKELARMLTTDATTLSRTIAPLEESGLVRSEAGADRRERRWFATVKGQQTLKRAHEHWEAGQRAVRKELSPSEWDVLRSLLGRLSEISAA